MSTITLSLSDKEITKFNSVYHEYLVDSNNQYIKYQYRLEGAVITVYTSNKAVFQGNNAHIYAAAFIKKEKAMAGSDEVGTGDYFGPVCVCACIVEENDYEFLRNLKVDDSKNLTDEHISTIAPKIMQRLKYSILILDNTKYNKVHETNNMNEIKAKLHNQAYINLIHKGYTIPKAAYVDQFEPEDSYFRHIQSEKEIYRDLTFEVKAESKYIAVACASIIARYAFLESMKKMSQYYKFEFPKGAGEIVDIKAQEFVNRYSIAKLKDVAKIHFKNTEKITSHNV